MNDGELIKDFDAAPKQSDAAPEPSIDPAILSSLFAIVDDEMGRTLCDQLLSDFRRMASGLEDAEPVVVAKIAHEMKGLSATIGAHRLADLAQTLNKAAESVSPNALAVLTYPVRQEVEGVLAVLNTCARAIRQQ